MKLEYDRIFLLKPALRIINRPRPNPSTLRKRAEARLLQAAVADATTDWDKARLLHELQVHQIELEIHNEELRHAYDEADTLRERFAVFVSPDHLGAFNRFVDDVLHTDRKMICATVLAANKRRPETAI